MSRSRSKGARGEALAARYLSQIGYEIIHQNLHLGHYEIDLICRDGDCLVFVEVKSSRTDHFGHPATWINDRKQEHLRQAAERYIRENNISDTDVRFDAITIEGDHLEHYRNAF